MTFEDPAQVRGVKDPQELGGGAKMLSKRSFSTTDIHAFSWPGKRPRKKQHTTPVTEETNIPIEQHKFSWPGKMHKKKNKAKDHTTPSEHVQSSSYNTVEEYSGISWEKFNWNSEHTSMPTQKEKHTTQHGKKKISSTRKSEAEFDVNQESSDYELTQTEVDYQTEDIANEEYPDYYSNKTDTGNIEPNQDLNENPTATEPSEMYHSSQSDMINIEPTYQESEEATSPEFLDNTFNQSEVFDGVSENPYSASQDFLTIENNEEASQELSGEGMNQDIATVSDENMENPVEQEPKNELTGLDSQVKKKLFELADELLKDSTSSTVTEEKSTEKLGLETPEREEETTIAPTARNDYENSQNPDEGPRMQFGGTEEPSNEDISESSENATEENEIVGAENPESPSKSPEEEEEASTELEEVSFNSTVIYDENEEELSSPNVENTERTASTKPSSSQKSTAAGENKASEMNEFSSTESLLTVEPEESSTLEFEEFEITREKEIKTLTETPTETKFTSEISSTLVLKELETSVGKEIELSSEISKKTKSTSTASSTLVLEGLETTREKESTLSTETPTHEKKSTSKVSSTLLLEGTETTTEEENKLSTESHETKSTSEVTNAMELEGLETTIRKKNKLSTETSTETKFTTEISSTLVLKELETTVGKGSKLSTETPTYETKATSEVSSTLVPEGVETTVEKESESLTETSTHGKKSTSEVTSTLVLEGLETTIVKESKLSTETSEELEKTTEEAHVTPHGISSIFKSIGMESMSSTESKEEFMKVIESWTTQNGNISDISWLASVTSTELAEEILPNTPKGFQIPNVIKVNGSKIYIPPYEMSFQSSATTLELAESTQQSSEAENEAISVQTTERLPILSLIETETSEKIPITHTETPTGNEMSTHSFPEQSEIVGVIFPIFPSLAAEESSSTSPTTGLEVETAEQQTQSLEEKSEETLSQVRLSSEKGYQNPTEIGIISKITNEPYELSSIVPSASEVETTPLFEFTVHNEINLLSTGVELVTTSSISIESPLEIPTLEENEKIEVTSGQAVESLATSATLSAWSVEAESQLPVTTYMGTQLPGEVETTFINNVWTVSENLPAWTTGIHMLEEVKPTTNVKSHETSTFVPSIHTPEIETTLLFQPNNYEETEVVSQTDQSISLIEEVEDISITTRISPLGISPTETSVVNESKSALTNEMGNQISEETTATTETKNVTSHEILTSTQAPERNETILFPHLKEYTVYTEMSPQSEVHLSSITEMNIRPSQEVEATSETVSVSTENTQEIAIYIPKEFKETPKIPYIPFHETPFSVRTAVTEENGWSPSKEFSTESVISETEIFTQQTPKEMSEETGIHMISTTESNIQILTETSKFDQEQNISVSTVTPPLAVSENEGLFTNVSTRESTEIGKKTEEISTEVNVASTEPTEVVVVTEMKIYAMNESSSQIEEINQSKEITTESTIVSKIPSLMQTTKKQLSTEMSEGTDIHMVSTTESNLQISTETSDFEVKIATELTYLPSHEISEYSTILSNKETSTEAFEATISSKENESLGAPLNGIFTSETIQFSEGIEKTSAKSETNENGQEVSTYENPFPSSNISTQPTSESSGVINQGTMETYKTNVTYAVTPEIIMASKSPESFSSTQSEASTSSQESEELLKPLGESFTSEKIPERTSKVIIPSVQTTERVLTKSDTTSETTNTSVISKEKPSSFETTAFHEPKEEELETFAFTRVLDKSTLCETCSEELEPKYTTPSTTELETEVESTVESEANIAKTSTLNSAQTEATAEQIGLSDSSTKLGHSPESAETLELEAESSVIHEGVTEATVSTIAKSDETEATSHLENSETTSESGHFLEESAETPELEVETTVEHGGEYNEESDSITEEITSYSGETSELGHSSEESGGSSKLEMAYTIRHEGEGPKTSELTIQESNETSETEEEHGRRVTEASASERPQEISEQTPSTEEVTRASDLQEETTIKHEKNVIEVSKTVIRESTEIETTPSSEKSEESTIEGSAETVELEVESTNEEEITEESESILGIISETETTSHSEEISELVYSSEESVETSEPEMRSTMRHEGEVSEASESTIEESNETSETEVDQEGKVTEASASEKPQEISEENLSTEEGTRASDLEETTIKHKENFTNVSETAIKESTEIETEESEKTYVEGGTETTQLEIEFTVKHKEEVTETSKPTIGRSAGTEETSHFGGTSELRHSSEENAETSELEMESTMKHEKEVSSASKSTIEESTETSGTEIEHEEKVTEASEKSQEKWEQSPATEEGNRVTDIEEETSIKYENNVTEVSKSVIEKSTEIETTPSSEKYEESSIEGSAETVELEVESTNEQEITEESESIPGIISESKTTSHSEGISELGYSSEESIETSELEMGSTMRHEAEVSEASESTIEESTETSEREVEQEGKVTEASASENPQEMSEENLSTEEGTRASDLEETTIKHKENVTNVSKTVIKESTEMETEESEKTYVEGGTETTQLKVESTVKHKEEVTEASESTIGKSAGTEETSHSGGTSELRHSYEESAETSELEMGSTTRHEAEVSEASESTIEESNETSERGVEQEGKVTEASASENPQEISEENLSTEEGTRASDLEETTIKHKENVTNVSKTVIKESTEMETEESEKTYVEGGTETTQLKVESTVKHKEEVTEASESTIGKSTGTEETSHSGGTSELRHSYEESAETSELEMESTMKYEGEVSSVSKSIIEESTETAGTEIEQGEKVTEASEKPQEKWEQSSATKDGNRVTDIEKETLIKYENNVTEVSKSVMEKSTEIDTTLSSEKSEESSIEGSAETVELEVESTNEEEITEESESILGIIFESETTSHSEGISELGYSSEESVKTSELEMESTMRHEGEISEVSESTIEESTETSETEVEQESTVKHKEEVTEASESTIGKSAGTEETSHSGGTSELRHSSEESTETSELEMGSTMRHGEVSEASESTIEESTETEAEQEGKVTEASTSEKPQEISEQSVESSKIEKGSTTEHNEVTVELGYSIETEYESSKIEVESTVEHEEGTKASVSSAIEGYETSERNRNFTNSVFEGGIESEATSDSESSEEISESVHSSEETFATSGLEEESIVGSEEVIRTSVSPTEEGAQTSELETTNGRIASNRTLKTFETTREVSIKKGGQEAETAVPSISSIENVMNKTTKGENTVISGTSVEEETIQPNTLSSEPAISITTEEEKRNTEQSGTTSALTVKFDLKNVSHPTTYMSSKITESTEEVAEGQLFHFSKTPEGSTICQECLNVTEKSAVSHEGKHPSTEEQEESTHEIASSSETETETPAEITIQATTQTESIPLETEVFVVTTEESLEHTKQTEASLLLSSSEEGTVSNISTQAVSSQHSTNEEEEGRTYEIASSPEKETENPAEITIQATTQTESIPLETEVIVATTEESLEHRKQTEASSLLSSLEEGTVSNISTHSLTHSTQLVLENAEKSSTHISEKHKHTTKAKTKPADFLQTLTELSGAHFTSTTEKVSPAESSEDIEVLTELGVQDEKFVLKTAIENVTGVTHPMESFEKVIHVASTRKPHSGSGPPKTVVFIVNNSGKKIKKVNETALQVLLNRSISEVDLEYIDLYNISKEPDTTNKSEGPEIAESLLLIGDGKICHRSDFESNRACVCDVDAYLKSIEHNLGDNLKVDIKHYNCSHLVSFHDGLTISNAIKPVERRKRSLMYLSSKDRSGNVIEKNDIKDVFSGDYELQTSDLNILAFPGTKAILYCHNKADALLGNKGVAYSWEFNGVASKNGEILSTIENPLIIRNVEIKNEGNYTCTKTEEGGKKESYDHELEVVTLPIYKIQTTIFYSVNDTCSLSDGDLLYSYLPKIMGPILCGRSGKLCTVDMARPRCFTKNDDNFFNVTVTATMNDIGSIFPGLNEKCSSTNCKLKVYTHMVGLVNKHSEIVKKLPVFSKISPHLEFLTNVSFSGGKSKLPKIITTCAGGYGIEKFKQRICVVCPQQTFSGDDEAFCKICPAGQYQPQAGSKVCLPCSSPIDDSMCLRMLYTDTKLFKIYVGVAFGLILLIIFIIIFWNSNSRRYPKRPFEGSLRHHRAMRRRNVADVEKQDREPLLKKDNENRRKSPPEVPPPDF